MITREKIVALFASASFLLIVAHRFTLALLCQLIVFVATILGIK